MKVCNYCKKEIKENQEFYIKTVENGIEVYYHLECWEKKQKETT